MRSPVHKTYKMGHRTRKTPKRGHKTYMLGHRTRKTPKRGHKTYKMVHRTHKTPKRGHKVGHKRGRNMGHKMGRVGRGNSSGLGSSRLGRVEEKRGHAGDADLRKRRLWYGWNQHYLGVGPPHDELSLEDLHQHFVTGKKVQPQLATAHARLSNHTC